MTSRENLVCGLCGATAGTVHVEGCRHKSDLQPFVLATQCIPGKVKDKLDRLN